MTAARVLTIDEWNDLLGQINDLATEPPAGCNALSEVSLVLRHISGKRATSRRPETS